MTGDAEDPPAGRDYVTIRDIISRLEELAGDLPEGTNTRFELGICDGKGAQIVDSADLDQYHEVSLKDARATGSSFVMLRGHIHPGEKPGRYLPGMASDADRELREMTGEGGT